MSKIQQLLMAGSISKAFKAHKREMGGDFPSADMLVHCGNKSLAMGIRNYPTARKLFNFVATRTFYSRAEKQQGINGLYTLMEIYEAMEQPSRMAPILAEIRLAEAGLNR